MQGWLWYQCKDGHGIFAVLPLCCECFAAAGWKIAVPVDGRLSSQSWCQMLSSSQEPPDDAVSVIGHRERLQYRYKFKDHSGLKVKVFL